jgi:Mrp family chromosome partitioning ATPase
MESLLQQAKTRYDLIVIDTPPLTAVSDAFPLLGKVDGAASPNGASAADQPVPTSQA